MQPTSYPIRLEALHHAWKQYIQQKQLPEEARPWFDHSILQSWQRCINRFDPHGRPRPRIIQPPALTSVFRANSDLITLSVPYLEDIFQYMEGSQCALLLADGTACLLKMYGDTAVVEMLERMGLGAGTYWSEGQLGTNALGLALLAAMPIQVVGPEHFFAINHHLVSTAAPIHDPHGRIIGLVGTVTQLNRANAHDLALVMASARAISNQIQANDFLNDTNRNFAAVRTMLSSITEGVLAWDDHGRITHINQPALRLLHLEDQPDPSGRSLTDLLTLPATIIEAIQNDEELHEVETTFHVGAQDIPCLLNLCRLATGFMAILRPLAQVRRLVQQHVGVEATITLNDFYSEEPIMRQLLHQASLAARGTAPVLICGEGGTGKNPLARAIHNASPRASGPFLPLNCQAIPHELLMSEFMGLAKTNQQAGRPSKFELAEGGTLFLDQIESLSLEMQAALLQVLEMGRVCRLGTDIPVLVNVRIIAATTADVDQLIREHSFDSQLYYRFGIFNLHLPPLRERVGDVPLLAERFLARITHERDRASWIEDQALTRMQEYPWPGNVRELESALERALTHSPDGVIRLANLPDVIRHGRVLTPHSPHPQPIITTAEAEREAIIRAGYHCHGRPSAMAKELGISRTTLWRRLKQLRLSPNQFKQ